MQGATNETGLKKTELPKSLAGEEKIRGNLWFEEENKLKVGRRIRIEEEKGRGINLQGGTTRDSRAATERIGYGGAATERSGDGENRRRWSPAIDGRDEESE